LTSFRQHAFCDANLVLHFLKKAMRTNVEIYYRAAFERIEDAYLLHEEGRYPFAIYASGLAVECLLRAFRMLKEPSFDERHDLWLLWKNTVLSDVHREPSYSQIYQTLMTISRFWNNGHRFASQNAWNWNLRMRKFSSITAPANAFLV
jgi:HEPN domain-containing protein